MIWRDAEEKPRLLGKYTVQCRDAFLLYPVFQLSWWNGDKWDHDVIAWLDPEIPERYLPESVPEECPICHQRPCRNACVYFEIKTPKPKGEWVDIRGFNFNPNKFYWAKEIYRGNEPWPDGRPFVLDGEAYRGTTETHYGPVVIWSIPIEEPPR